MPQYFTNWSYYGLLSLVLTTSNVATAQQVGGETTANPDVATAVVTPATAGQAKPEDETDVVVLKAGGFYRGVIIEQQPGSHVTIRLPSGIVRRVALGEVQFSGPFANKPSADAVAPPTTAPIVASGAAMGSNAAIAWLGGSTGVLLRLRSGVPDATVWAAKVGPDGTEPDSDGWIRICSLPCDAKLAKGVYRFSVAPPNDERVDVDETVEVAGPASYMATVERHNVGRVLGWVAFGLGLTTGLSSVVALKDEARLIGATFGFGSAIVGIGFGLRQDGAFVSPVKSNDTTSARRQRVPELGVSGAF